MTKKFKVKVETPKVRKDWGPVKPYTRIHGETEYDRDQEKEQVEDAIEEALEEEIPEGEDSVDRKSSEKKN